MTRAFQPDRFLLVNQHAVAVKAQTQFPALVAVPQVLEWGIPDQPVEQQRLAAAPARRNNGNQPGSVRTRLGSSEGLPAVQRPGDRRPRGRHRFPPGVGGPGTEAVAARVQLSQGHPKQTVLGLGQSLGRLIIDLHHHMGPEAQIVVLKQRPVGNLQLQSQRFRVHHGAIVWREKSQSGMVFVEGSPQFLNPARRCHFLQARTRSGSGLLRLAGLVRNPVRQGDGG